MDNDGQWSALYPLTIVISNVKRYFYVKDHLGNIRQTLDESKTVVAARDYYPYGETLREYNSGQANEKYKFNEKERDAETGIDYSISRYYDGKLGIWLQADPLTDKYPGASPYNYVMNNPLRYQDPDGTEVRTKNKEDAENTVKDIKEVYPEAPVTYEKVTEQKSFLFFTWTDEHYVINVNGTSSFDWGQDIYLSGLYDVLTSDEVVFNVSYVDGNSTGHPITLYNSGGGKTSSYQGGANIKISSTGHNTNDPRGVVLMHELLGHGHPVGGNDARNVNMHFNDKMGVQRGEYGFFHGGYHKQINWKHTGLYKRSK